MTLDNRTKTLLFQYSEWLDGEGLVVGPAPGEVGQDGRTHEDLVEEFIASEAYDLSVYGNNRNGMDVPGEALVESGGNGVSITSESLTRSSLTPRYEAQFHHMGGQATRELREQRLRQTGYGIVDEPSEYPTDAWSSDDEPASGAPPYEEPGEITS